MDRQFGKILVTGATGLVGNSFLTQLGSWYQKFIILRALSQKG